MEFKIHDDKEILSKFEFEKVKKRSVKTVVLADFLCKKTKNRRVKK